MSLLDEKISNKGYILPRLCSAMAKDQILDKLSLKSSLNNDILSIVRSIKQPEKRINELSLEQLPQAIKKDVSVNHYRT